MLERPVVKVAGPVETPDAAESVRAEPKEGSVRRALAGAGTATTATAVLEEAPGDELAEFEAELADDEAVDAETDAANAAETGFDEQPAVDEGEPEADAVAEPAEAPAPAAPNSKSKFRVGRRPGPVAAPTPTHPSVELALSVEGLHKYFGSTAAVEDINLSVRPGSFYGIVGPNGAGKTTTLSMITGLLRPDAGVVRVYGLDVWSNAALAKKNIGVLPDGLRLFDRLTGAEFLYHAGALRGLDRATIAQRSADLSAAFGLEHSLHRLVSDYSSGMTKKIAIAAAMIHAPRLLVLDEPFESVDPVSTAVVLEVLQRFTEAGGTVILSSHSMELTERVCDALAVIVDGAVLAEGTIDEVCAGRSLEERFVELAGGEAAVKGMEWLQNFSD